jgi:hypothetical protein
MMMAKPKSRPAKWLRGLVSLPGLVSLCALSSMTFGFTPLAQALVPRAQRVIDAVAHANVSGRRVRALRFKVRMRIGDGPPVATGELVSHPTGLARLELRAGGGLVERHILLGDTHSASRNARLLVRPRAFLPPLFVLQSNSGAVLEAALGTLGVDRGLVGLAPCGDYDCYVIGDPTRAVRGVPMRSEAEPQAGLEGEEAGLESSEDREAFDDDDMGLEAGPPKFFASLWVDTVDYSVRQLESRAGVRIVLGPYVSFERLKVPQWWSIEEPGKRPVRFEVAGVIEVNAPAAAFSKTWLMAPVNEAPPKGDGTASIKEAAPAVSGDAPADVSSAPADDYDSPDLHTP